MRNTSRPVPAGMPVLSAGRHRRPEQGSCLMEYVSVLAGERFTDHPRCTHRVVARLARLVNDRVDRPTRARLAPLAPMLVGAGGPTPWVRAVVVDHLTALGLALAPRHRRLARARRRALAVRAGCGGVRRGLVAALDTSFVLESVANLVDTLPAGLRHEAWRAVLDGLVVDLADPADGGTDAERRHVTSGHGTGASVVADGDHGVSVGHVR